MGSEQSGGDESGGYSSGLRLGLKSSTGEFDDDFEEDDDLEKEYQNADDVELLEY